MRCHHLCTLVRILNYLLFQIIFIIFDFFSSIFDNNINLHPSKSFLKMLSKNEKNLSDIFSIIINLSSSKKDFVYNLSINKS